MNLSVRITEYVRPQSSDTDGATGGGDGSGGGEETTAFDPEAGLVNATNFTPGRYIYTSSLDIFSPVVFAFDVEGLDGSAGGILFEIGSGSKGSYCGFNAAGEFVIRTGSGGFGSATSSSLLLPADAIAGDGTLVFAFIPGVPVRCRLWWNGEEYTGAVGGEGGIDRWASSNNGGYLRSYGTVFGGGISSYAPSYLTISDLRYYENQTVSTQ